MPALDTLQRRLGYQYRDPQLLTRALTHRSHEAQSYERLEFLGDSILNFVIAEHLYHQFPDADEGQLSRLRARIVRRDTLATVARTFETGEFLLMGSGELKSGGFNRSSILSDALEAIIGGIYLEAGLATVAERITTWFAPHLDALDLSQSQKDPKSRLQEYLQARQCEVPEYRLVEVEGKSHEQTFTIECHVALLDAPATGVANNRRDAEQQAAVEVLARLGVGAPGKQS